jgi:hypothetical protein
MLLDRLLFRKHLEKDEQIVMIVHKHWLIGLQFLFWPSASFLLSWYLLYTAPFRAIFLLVSLWSIGSLIWWLRNFLDYYLDAWIISNHGIIDLEWHGWFHRQASRILYSDVQGVSYEIQGFAGTVLRYGIVTIEKISTGTTISLSHAARPRVIQGIIMRNMEAYIHGKHLTDAKHVQELLATYVAEQVQLEKLRSGKP